MGLSDRQYLHDDDPKWDELTNEMILECEWELIEEQLESDDKLVCVLCPVLAIREVKKF